MSVEKLSDQSRSFIEENPYAQILNTIIEHIKDNDAYRMYCYLYAKSREWTVIKQWTAKQCGVGQRKAKQCWSYLERCGLIEYTTVRDEQGKFIKHDIRILNGSKFDLNEPFLKQKDSRGAETAPVASQDIQWCNNPPSGETTRVDIAPLLNKDITNKDSELKKEKSFYIEQKKDNKKRHDFADSMDQMANEKKVIDIHQKQKTTSYPQSLRDLVNEKCRGMLINERSHGS